MTNRKKPGVAFWATLALVVMMLYVLSIGPVFWLSIQNGSPAWVDWAYFQVYSPVLWLYETGPQPIHDVLDWYVFLWQ